MLSYLVLSLLLPCLSSSTLAQRNLQIHESRQDAPGGYTRTGPADPDTVLTLYLSLVQSDYDGLIDALYDVSTPSSAHYGQYLSAEEVCSLLYSPCACADSPIPRGRDLHETDQRDNLDGLCMVKRERYTGYCNLPCQRLAFCADACQRRERHI